MHTSHAFRLFVTALAFLVLSQQDSWAAGYSLIPEINPGATREVSISLEAGGKQFTGAPSGDDTYPLEVAAQIAYREQLLSWSPDPKELTRSVRVYENASASIKYSEELLEPRFSTDRGPIVAEIRGGRLAINSLSQPLSRPESDLLRVSGDSLALDRLLPNREIAEGENWDHSAEAIAPLLGMDHVAVCEVSSVVIGDSHKQVQIRMSGTVHGTVDGAPTEIELRGAYLFHLDKKRISKFNLAIKEKRSSTEVVPGLDSVAQLRIVVDSTPKKLEIGQRTLAQAKDLSRPVPHTLQFDGGKLGFRLAHDSAWYLTIEQSDRLSFRYLREGSVAAHCNISTSPARSAGRETTLEQFERDVRRSLDENLESVEQSRQWTTALGNECLGVVAKGKVDGVEMQWRYYLVQAPDKPRVSLSITVEKTQIESFADADRQIIDSLELVGPNATTTASRSNPGTSR